MENKSPELQESKQVLDYYRLFGKDRDIRQYLTLPPIIDVNDSNVTLSDDKSPSVPEPEAKNVEEVVQEQEPQASTSTQQEAKTKPKSKNKDFIFNIESQIDINYDLESPQNENEEVRQVTFKPKGILKVDDKQVADQKRNTISPTSSLASNKRLEWDSLADIGYNNNQDLNTEKPLSTLERIALRQGHDIQYGENIIDKAKSKTRKFIGKPTAESTPIILKSDELSSNADYVSNIKSPASSRKHKSLNDINVKSAEKVDKYIQTTLTTNKDDSSKVTEDSKENIKRTPIKTSSKSRMLKKRLARRKLMSSKPILTDDESSPDKPEENILKSDNKFNISQSSNINDNLITIADSFEYVSRLVYDKKSGKTSDYDKRSSKTSDYDNTTSSVSKSESNQSVKHNIKKSSATSTSTSLSSNNYDPLFDDVKLSSLNHDIKTSIRLLNCLMTSKKGNLELKKRMVKRIVKRLLEANYSETTSDVSRTQSKLKDYTSSTNSKHVTTSQTESPDPSYSLPENLVANVPWKPYKFGQGVDFIRVPDAPAQKPKSIFTMKNKEPVQDSKEIDQQRVFKDQQTGTENPLEGTGLINYAKQEKDIQLAWINSEIEHLNYLKGMLENNTYEKPKFDSLGAYKGSERGDAKFDFNFYANLRDIPNRNMVYPLVTSTDSPDKTCPKSIEQSSSSSSRSKSLLKNSGSSAGTSKVQESTHKSSTSGNESIREQIKRLAESIEKLKQSQASKVQDKNKEKQRSSSRSSCLTYPDWDSHIHISRPYSDVIGIDKAKRQQKPCTRSSPRQNSKDKVSSDPKVEDSSSHSKLVESSGTHTSLKSATISINGQNKSTEFSSGWETYEKASSKPKVQTISTQTSDHLKSDDKMVEAVIVSCNHCKKCSCKCNKKTQTLEKKEKATKAPVAYVLTFETESTPTNSSSKNGKKPSLDEMKVKLPYNRENRTKHKKISNKKTVITVYDNKSKFNMQPSDEMQIIEVGKSSSNYSNTKTDSLSEDAENTARTLSESTMLSTSTDSFLVAREDKKERVKEHKPTVQECLVIYRSDFVKKADQRRNVINRIAELR